jgi:two-component system chemotaxis response regulator CheB
MPDRIIVIGASAGGVSAVKDVLANLAPNLPSPVFVVIHRPADMASHLEEVLRKTSALPVVRASNRAIKQGMVYVAPPDRHLIVERGRMKVIRGPKENLYRPAIDALFRSAAFAYRAAVIGVVLTGLLDDGTAGLFYVKRYGGITTVQDPNDAQFKAMPENALAHVQIDHVVPLPDIAPLLTKLVRQPLRYWQSKRGDHQHRGMKKRDENESVSSTPFTCPECHGPISVIQNGSLVSYRCLVGHAYGATTFVQAQHDRLERTLWMAAGFLRQKALLETRDANAARDAGNQKEAGRLEKLAAETTRQALAVEAILADLAPD